MITIIILIWASIFARNEGNEKMKKGIWNKLRGKTAACARFLSRAIFAIVSVCAPVAAAAEIHLYTDRQEVFLRELADAFEKESGDAVKVLFLKKGLLERARTEGADSPADLYLVKGIGTIAKFLNAGLAAPLRDAVLESATANESLRDKNGRWYAVTRRVRAIFAAPGAQIRTYEELANSEHKGEICIRSGANGYNIDLFADIGAQKGRPALRRWLEGLKANLARKPAGKDRTQINAVADGECKIGIANSYYYFGLLRAADESRRAELKKVRMIVPENPHINITAMLPARHSQNREATKRFMRFLLGETAQQILADKNNEFPVRDGVKWPAELRPYQSAVEKGAARLSDTAKWTKTASELADEIRFDN